MELSDLYLALIIGTILSLLFVEITGVLPSGIVIPGYLALAIHQPLFILFTLLISFLTYLIVVYGVGKITILYGKRKFAAMILVAIFVKIALMYMFPAIPTSIAEMEALEVIIPGLIANTIQKQGVLPTILSTLLLTYLTYGCIVVYHLFY